MANAAPASSGTEPASTRSIPHYALAFTLIGAGVFAVFPTLSLYSANQNTKYLYGMAKAGIGRLADDWLITQGSGLPIFDALVYVTAALAGGWAFYLWQFASIVTYTIGSYGIARIVGLTRPERFGPDGRWFLPLFGVWFVALNSNNASGRLFEGVALQYINGAVFEPASFGVLALLGLLLFRLGQTGWAAVLIVAAAWIHPAYAIPGLLLFLGMGVARWRFGPVVHAPVLVLAAGMIGCLGAAAFAYSLLQPADPAVQAEAIRIITEERIPQHSLPELWFPRTDTLTKMVLVPIALWLTRRDPLGWVLLVVTAAIVVLSCWVWATHDLALALAAPWRASAIVVPAVNAILLARLLQFVAGWAEDDPSRLKLALGVTAAFLAVGIGLGVRNRVVKNWMVTEPSYFAWVRQTARPGDLYLTPISHDKFRLATGQPQYVSWKTHPHRGSSVIEWRRRIEAARAVTGGPAPACDTLDTLHAEGVTHLVRMTGDARVDCTGWSEAFRDDIFVILTRGDDSAALHGQ